jgi:uncharacterized protein involved in exopolysaccharide biosynthesis
MRRYFDTFLRYWIVVLIPIVVLPVAAFLLFGHTARTYVITTRVNADPTTLSNYAYEEPYASPAQSLADYMTSNLMGSLSFDQRVLRRVLTTSAATHMKVLPDPAAIEAVPDGYEPVALSYASTDPVLGKRLIQAFLQQASLKTRHLNLKQTSKGLSELQATVRTDISQFDVANGQFQAYVKAHGIAPSDINSLLPYDPTLGNLYSQVQNRQTTLQKDRAALETEQSQRQSLKSTPVLDIFQNTDPIVAFPQSTRKTEIKNLAIALLLGLLLGGGFLVLKTAFDRSVRFSNEVPELIGLPILANIPYSEAQPERGHSRTNKPAVSEVA